MLDRYLRSVSHNVAADCGRLPVCVSVWCIHTAFSYSAPLLAFHQISSCLISSWRQVGDCFFQVKADQSFCLSVSGQLHCTQAKLYVCVNAPESGYTVWAQAASWHPSFFSSHFCKWDLFWIPAALRRHRKKTEKEQTSTKRWLLALFALLVSSDGILTIHCFVLVSWRNVTPSRMRPSKVINLSREVNITPLSPTSTLSILIKRLFEQLPVQRWQRDLSAGVPGLEPSRPSAMMHSSSQTNDEPVRFKEALKTKRERMIPLLSFLLHSQTLTCVRGLVVFFFF